MTVGEGCRHHMTILSDLSVAVSNKPSSRHVSEKTTPAKEPEISNTGDNHVHEAATERFL
jgi:hypothetical protein